MLTATNLHKAYRRHTHQVPVLRGLDLAVNTGEFLAVVGQSGSGKSTLLHLLGTLDRPDQGEVRLDGRRIDNLPSPERDRLRNQTFGFIFQFYHLLPELSMFENVLIPAMIGRSVWGWFSERRALKRRAAELLERVGLGHRLKHRPRELSGGEIVRLLRDLNRSDGLTIIMVTHNLDLVAATDRVVRLAAGRVEDPTSLPPGRPEFRLVTEAC